MIATEKKAVASRQFPEKEVKSALTNFWAEKTEERSNDPFASEPKQEGTLYSILPVLDSLVIVCSFLILENILKTKVPIALVKKGGYHSEEEMLKDLLPKLQKFYEKQQKKLAD